jgi:hypothetical protein
MEWMHPQKESALSAAMRRSISAELRNPIEFVVGEFEKRGFMERQEQYRRAEAIFYFSREALLKKWGIAHDDLLADNFHETHPDIYRLFHDVPWHHLVIPRSGKAVDEHPERTRLYGAAMAVFNRRESVTVSAIAREMKLARATLYRMFSRTDMQKAIGLTRAGASAAETPLEFGQRRKTFYSDKLAA